MRAFNETLMIRRINCPPGCSACEKACAERMGLPVIKSVRDARLKLDTVVVCNQCTEPACLGACPTGAITKSELTGLVTIDREKCAGCGLCALSCPYGGISYDEVSAKSYKCDRCEGEDSRCVAACPHGVLSYVKSRAVWDHFHDDLQSASTGLCAGCPGELAGRVMLKVIGANMVLFRTPGCQTIFLSRVPSVSTLMTNIASSMTGASRYFRQIGRDDITVVCVVGDGATADIGFQPLSGAAARKEHILYICNDNEAYMNTGIQSSGTTPALAWTTTTWAGDKGHGKAAQGKYMPLIMLMHSIPYVATATVGFMEDYVQKLEKAKEAAKRGTAYIHLCTPCPTGWRAPVDLGIELSRLAVETNHFPLWEAEDGQVRFTHRVEKPKPIREFYKMMGRFSHLKEDDFEDIQQGVDRRMTLIERLALG
jgi:phenylglyoxylate dehydrogenase beta subunit